MSIPSTPEMAPVDSVDLEIKPEIKGVIEDNRINEASGLVASRFNPGVLWVHNDSGDSPRVFAINEAGQTLAVYTLENANARDWEDMAIGPGQAEQDHLYLADIGDNNTIYDHVMIYKIAEPKVENSSIGVEETVPLAGAYKFIYPDQQQNAETVWVDPGDNRIYIMTKNGRTETIYRGSMSNDGEEQVLEEVGQFSFPIPSLIGEQATGGDISRDGLKLLVKSYGTVYLWRRDNTDASFFDSAPVTLPYEPEPQGEAIAWSADGAGYYTLSEERNDVEAVLYYYPYQLDNK